MKKNNSICAAVCMAALFPALACADDTAYFVPQLLGAQYTFVDQHQDALRSPYAGPLSLLPGGDTEQTHTFGAYFGVQFPWHLQFYFDIEKFDGEGVSGATGLGGLTNGDVVRSGIVTLAKRPYVARHFLRWSLPLGDGTQDTERGQDQLPGAEASRRIDVKLGKLAANDDFDKNRYANSTRTQFMNWSLWNNTAWDFAADTRGYTNGLVVAWVEPLWTLRYGIYQMPRFANGQTLDNAWSAANGQQVELELHSVPGSWVVRLLGYDNTARMGVYRNALDAAAGGIPSVQADDKPGRHKYGFGVNAELPLADNGDTGLFTRLGWNDGKTESFAFTEVDRLLSVGAQVSGAHWQRANDRLGIAVVNEALSPDHRDYLAAGGSGFLLGDGRLNYGHEQIVETYYAFQPVARVTLSPDLQYVRNPGYNRDRGPAKFLGLRAHLEW